MGSNVNNLHIYEGINSQSIILDGVNKSEIIIKKDSQVTLDIEDVINITNLDLVLEENSILSLKILSTWKLFDFSITANVNKNASLNIVIADFREGDTNFKSIVNLKGENSSSEFKLASLSNKEYIKKYSISFNHEVKETTSNIEAYGVSKDYSKIHIDGISHIYEDSIKANASQSARVILFDDTSKAVANPILKIDCNDVKAKHACAIGSLKDEHLFYLLSRGINVVEARNLITLGYLLPVSKYFDKEKGKKIEEIIGGSF